MDTLFLLSTSSLLGRVSVHNPDAKKSNHNGALDSGHVELPEHRGEEKGQRSVAQGVENDDGVPDGAFTRALLWLVFPRTWQSTLES